MLLKHKSCCRFRWRTVSDKKMMDLFDINNLVFTAWGYGVCWLELLGVVTGFIAIYLAGRGKVLNFWVGLLNCLIYFDFFLQSRLYSMMLLQLVFFVINIYGIVQWTRPKVQNNSVEKIKITRLVPVRFWLGVLFTMCLGVLWGVGVVWLAQQMPQYVQKPVYPLLDAILLMGNVFGQLLLAMKKIENWWIWIVVDTVSIVLWLVLGMYLTAILYLLYLLIAIDAFLKWNRQMNIDNNKI